MRRILEALLGIVEGALQHLLVFRQPGFAMLLEEKVGLDQPGRAAERVVQVEELRPRSFALGPLDRFGEVVHRLAREFAHRLGLAQGGHRFVVLDHAGQEPRAGELGRRLLRLGCQRFQVGRFPAGALGHQKAFPHAALGQQLARRITGAGIMERLSRLPDGARERLGFEALFI